MTSWHVRPGRSAQAGRDFWLPPPASTRRPIVDALFYFILVLISVFFFALIVGLMTLFVVRYRRRPGVEPGKPPSHNTLLEMIWTVIPVLIVAVIFYHGFTGYMEMRTPPREAYEIQVVAQQVELDCSAIPNGHVDENLHVPVDEPVRLMMRREDVIHGLFIPGLPRQDGRGARPLHARPGSAPTEPGEYDSVCTEYCGTSHSDMLAKVVVHPPGEFDAWLEDAADCLKNLPPAEARQATCSARAAARSATRSTARPAPGPTLQGHLRPRRAA